MSWCKCRLFSFSVEVLWVSVQRESSNFDERVVTLWPYLGNIIDVKSVLFTVCKRHNLHVPSPGWEVALLNVFEKVSRGEIFVILSHLSSFCSGEVFDSLISLEVVLNKECLALIIDPLVGVGAVAVHVAISVWCSSVGEEDHDLVKGLRREGPEIPCHLLLLDACLRVSLLAMNEVWKLDWISDEENRCVVSDHVIVAFFSVELDRKSTRISVTIVGTTLTSNS